MTTAQIVVRLACPDDASAIHDVTLQAFAARQPLDPPAEALSDTLDDVAGALAGPGFGVIGQVDGQIAGSLLVRLDEAAGGQNIATLRRVGVLPKYRHLGVADAMVRSTLRGLADSGIRRARLLARMELPQIVAWWRARGFMIDHDVPHGFIMSANLPAPIDEPTPDDMRALGRSLSRHLRAGDLVIASGDLGAGKTVLAQGIGQGLGVAEAVISPTFVLSRVHRSASGPSLVHVDAYRLASAAELEDIDVDAALAESVVYVEWGAGLAEGLNDERLEIHIERLADETRRVYLMPVGRRWREEAFDE